MAESAWLGLGAEAGAVEEALALTNAAQVRALTSEQAARHLPVRLRGVVLLVSDGANLTVADETAGIFVEAKPDSLPGYRRGQLTEVEGVTDPGKFAPVVKLRSTRLVGEGRIPEPRPVTLDELLTGRLDAQWVEVSGLVHSSHAQPTASDTNGWEVALSTGGGQLMVQMSQAQGEAVLADSEVRLRGICFYQFNKARQLLKPILTVPPGEEVVVKTPAPADPYAVPAHAVASLMQFSLEGASGRRVRVRGVVMHSEPGEGFWIRDGVRGLHVRSQGRERLEIGTVVDALGFPGQGEYSPVLEDAVFRKCGTAPAPVPVFLEGSARALDHDGDLVELEAVIELQKLALDGCRLTLADGASTFAALLRLRDGLSAPANWRPGSRVRVAGICSVMPGEGQVVTGTVEPREFRILLRSTGDLRLLELPPWWTTQHLAWLLGIIVAGFLLVVAGVTWLGRQRLRKLSMERLKAEAEFSAVWHERNRIARELHDTLAQGLGAISVHLELIKSDLEGDAKIREQVEKVRLLARASMADVRKSIWNMRSQVLENGDLAAALAGILETLAKGNGLKSEIRVLGRSRRLAPVTENNLLRIGQEAIANAVKHARAGRIDVVLEFGKRELRLTVRDDGGGVDLAHPPAGGGGFGLVGMRERAAQLHGELSMASKPGQGTVVTMTLPLPG